MQAVCSICGEVNSSDKHHIFRIVGGYFYHQTLRPKKELTAPLCRKCHREADKSRRELTIEFEHIFVSLRGELRRFWRKGLITGDETEEKEDLLEREVGDLLFKLLRNRVGGE